MQLYKVVVDMVVPEDTEIWSWVHPQMHETLDAILAPKVVNVTTEPLSNNAYRITTWFNDEPSYVDFQLFKESNAIHRDRTTYEVANGISRIIISQEYVDVE